MPSSHVTTGQPTHFGGFTASVLAAQTSTMRVIADQWARSAQYVLSLTTPPTAPRSDADGTAERAAFGAGAEKLTGTPADVKVGYEAKFTRTVTRELIEAFGDVSGDHSRLHYDEEYASGTRFGSRIGHGALSVAFISAALSRLPGLVVYLSQDLKFTAPVKPGETVTAVAKVTERPPGKAWAILRTVCTLDDGTVVAEGEAKVLLMDEPA